MDPATAFLLGVTLLMGVAFAGLVALVALSSAGPRAATIAGLGWYLFAFAPFAWRFAAPSPDSFLIDFGMSERPLDYGGAVPFGVVLAAGVLAVKRFLPLHDNASQRRTRLSAWELLVLCAVWIGWMVASEQDITRFSAIVAINSLASVLAALAVSLLLEFVRRRRVSSLGLQHGVVAGLAAATASCAYLDTASALVTGALAGMASILLALRKRAPGDLAGAVVVPVASGAVVGLLALGLLDETRGFFYTGQPDLTLSQFVVICLSGIVAFAFSGAAMLLGRILFLRQGAEKQKPRIP